MQRIVVLSGAGMSAESGIKTFRDADGLWEGHGVMQVATWEGWIRNPSLVLQFYNARRRQLKEVSPNEGHYAISSLQDKFHVDVITQNVDDLHERAGSNQVMHLHGELRKVRSIGDPSLVYNWMEDLSLGDTCEAGHQLRPHIVWFGEDVPLLPRAAQLCQLADIAIIVGTSLQVYPAASLVAYCPPGIPVYYIDPNPKTNYELEHVQKLEIISRPATAGLTELVKMLL